MSKMSLELSDGLALLDRELAAFDADGAPAMTTADLLALRLNVLLLHSAARRLECEVSKLQWNMDALADRESAITREVLSQIDRPGTNLRLFPIIPRPLADGTARTGGTA